MPFELTLQLIFQPRKILAAEVKKFEKISSVNVRNFPNIVSTFFVSSQWYVLLKIVN